MKNGGQWRFAAVLAIAGAVMLGLNWMTVPTLSDDILYRFEWQKSEAVDWPRMEHLSQLIESQMNHYLIVNGRAVVHTIGQLLLNFVPLHVLHTINALMAVALLWLSVKVSGIRHEKRWMAAAWLFGLLFLVIKGFHGAMLWSIGTFNYLWVLVATCLFVLYINRVKDSPINVLSLLMLPVAVMVGWSHEALSLPLSVAMTVYMVRNRNNMVHSALLPVFLGYMLGTVLCLSSPGMWTRVADSPSIQSKILSGAINLCTNIRIFYLLLLSLVWQYRTDRDGVKRHLQQWAYGYVALLTALGIVVSCGATLERVGFYVDYLSALLLTNLLLTKETSYVYDRLTAGLLVFMVIFSVPVLFFSWQNYQCYYNLKHQLLTADRTVIRVDGWPKNECFVSRAIRSRYTMPSVEFGFNQCYQAFNQEDINTRCAAVLNGKKHVSFLPADVLDRIEADSTAFTDYELDEHGNVFIWRMKDGQKTPRRLTFELAEEDVAKLPWRQRILLYHGDSYELDPLKFRVVNVAGSRYLVFTKPVTNIYRRIKNVVTNNR